jgi:tetratricopeptide (TPR) repeat protein
MKLARGIAGALVFSSAAAAAAPASIRLTKDQIDAAAKAAGDKVKATADDVRAAKCEKQAPDPDHADAPTLLALGACYRDAGWHTFAGIYWEQLAMQYPKAKEVAEAERLLGPLDESGGNYGPALHAYVRYAETFPRGADARADMVRGICLAEQLGLDAEAEQDLRVLTKLWPKPAVDADHLCDTVRPIQPPAP